MKPLLQPCDLPSLPGLKWLVAPGPSVPDPIRPVLYAELYTNLTTAMMGIVDGMAVAGVFVLFDGARLPAWLLPLLLSCLAVRLVALLVTHNADVLRNRQVANLYLATSILWCWILGVVLFYAMRSNVPSVQVLAAALAAGMVGGTFGRNYPAPRLASLLSLLLYVPFAAGAALSRAHWLILFVPMGLPFIFGTMRVADKSREFAVLALSAQHESQRRALQDPLTGLLNRRAVSDPQVLEMLGEPLEGMPTFSVFCLDLDRFKAVNDTLGHMAGDELLCAVARRLEAMVRPDDILVRLGGDEFLLLAPGVSAQEAHHVAARLVARIAGEPYAIERGQRVEIGVSLGYACAPQDGTALEALYERADAALYDSKAAGRGIATRCSSASQPVG
jgi:diguanylate cyclase (GGDEF)-like protein